jgi:hypothetical protein
MFSATPDSFDPRSRLFRRWCDAQKNYSWMSSGIFRILGKSSKGMWVWYGVQDVLRSRVRATGYLVCGSANNGLLF